MNPKKGKRGKKSAGGCVVFYRRTREQKSGPDIYKRDACCDGGNTFLFGVFVS